MEFWLSVDNFNEKLQLPVNPGEFRIKKGNKNTVIDIIDLGELNLLGGKRLAGVELASFFPANYAPYCAYRDIPKPWDAVALIEKWSESKQPIRLIITDTPVNMQFAIDNFEYGEKGGTRDISYILALSEYRYVEVKKVGSASIQSARPNTRPNSNTYTVKSGDYLSLISKRVYGDSSKWRTIYNANISVIGPDPNLIQPGQQLVIP